MVEISPRCLFDYFPTPSSNSPFLISPYSLTLKKSGQPLRFMSRETGKKKDLMVCYFYSVSRLLIWYDLSQRRRNNKLLTSSRDQPPYLCDSTQDFHETPTLSSHFTANYFN